jgi:hypothetical protein
MPTQQQIDEKIRQIQDATTDEFNDLFPRINFSKWPQEVRDIAIRKLDQIILNAINNFQGVPSLTNLVNANGGPLPYGCTRISGRMKKNPKLKQACIARGIWYVTNCSEEIFNQSLYMWSLVPKEVKKAINKRKEKIEQTQIRKINEMADDQFADFVNGLAWKSSAQPIQDAVHARIDSDITRIINSLCAPSFYAVFSSCVEQLNYSREVLAKRLQVPSIRSLMQSVEDPPIELKRMSGPKTQNSRPKAHRPKLKKSHAG